MDRTSQLAAILDAAHDEQAYFERIARSVPLGPKDSQRLGRDIWRASHDAAQRMVTLAGKGPSGWGWAKEQLKQHKLHADFLLQSDFIAQALRKPYGYAGDKDLMLMIYRAAERGASTYAELKDHVYLGLPAAEAVRERVRGMERVLRQLPAGAKVLCLACGPAWEIQQIMQDRALNFRIDLLDHDPKTIDYTRRHLDLPGIRHALCNAFDLIKGKTSFGSGGPQGGEDGTLTLEPSTYDLVYTTGLYDYIDSFPMNPSRGATGLTSRLFSLLKPGGRLFVGNFLTPGGENPHKVPHQFMMEAYSDWKLIYRTIEDVRGFCSTIPPESFHETLLDETLQKPAGANAVIGFLRLERTR